VVVDVVIPLEGSDTMEVWRKAAASALKLPVSRIADVRLRKHSIDARRRPVKIQLRLEIGLDYPLPEDPPVRPDVREVAADADRIIIVGCGPAGMFAALKCLEHGFRPVILERGKDASTRRFDLAPILRKGTVIEDSNYCFGEGGAGTFSDGKLYTRATKRGPVAEVYRTLVAHGAPEQILVDAHPHIGSNLLPNVVKNIRGSIIGAGGEVHFQSRVEDLIIRNNRLIGVVTADGREWTGRAVIMATGHSARDIFRLLQRHEVHLEPKAFAVGMRIEHEQSLIDRVQYHLHAGEQRPDLLPAARYSLATKIRGRGVHSFCMCPGGFIVPASTENDEVVVNGMSLARRDSRFANSGMVVTVEPEDTGKFAESHGVLAGVAFQKALEQAAKQAGGGGQQAPAQRLVDFLKGSDSRNLPPTSYFPGTTPARLDRILPEWMVWRLREGLRLFGRRMRGYVNPEASLLGFETRTSSPVRVPRDSETLENPSLPGLFPCGEGAGYAGGIVSAALDGMRCATAACGVGTARAGTSHPSSPQEN
jgi:hypothetical protein